MEVFVCLNNDYMRNCFLFISLFFIYRAVAQEKIETDRPDQTENANLVPKGWFQQEVGFLYEKEKSVGKFYYHPTVLSKYGIGRRFELRLITEWTTIEMPVPPDGKEVQSGLLPIQAGGKIGLWEEKGARPKTSLIFHSNLPWVSSRKFRELKWLPDFRFTMINSLAESLSLGYNVGGEWDGESRTMRWLYTFAPAFPLADKLNAYVEAFGFISKGSSPEHSLDGGLSFLISPNAQVDLSAGFGISPAAPDFYTGIGFSYRIK